MSDRRQLVNRTFKTVHFLIAFGFLIFGLVKFVSNPPYFDAKALQKQLPEDWFQVLKCEIFKGGAYSSSYRIRPPRGGLVTNPEQ